MSRRPLPATIDDVIVRLDEIVRESVRTSSRLGYFAALYNRVTMTVRDGIRASAFDDNPRMERLDVAFANRYLAAYDAWQQREPLTRVWRVAFEAASRSDLSVLQHLFLGMNAHINLDLGIAAAEVSPGAGIDGLHGDFNRINGVLASLLPTVEAQLREMSPLLDSFTTIADRLDNVDDRVGTFSMEKARDGAWRFALRLAPLRSSIARGFAVDARDVVTAAVGLHFREPGPLTLAFGGPDGVDVAASVRVLARGEASIAEV